MYYCKDINKYSENQIIPQHFSVSLGILGLAISHRQDTQNKPLDQIQTNP
jgi:hypothetical protein